MTGRGSWAACCVALPLLLGSSVRDCGFERTDREVGEACVQDDDCVETLRCKAGVCTPPEDAGSE